MDRHVGHRFAGVARAHHVAYPFDAWDRVGRCAANPHFEIVGEEILRAFFIAGAYGVRQCSFALAEEFHEARNRRDTPAARSLVRSRGRRRGCDRGKGDDNHRDRFHSHHRNIINKSPVHRERRPGFDAS